MEMITSVPVYNDTHKTFLLLNLNGIYCLSYFFPFLFDIYKVYSIWFLLWILFPYLSIDIHQYFSIPGDKKIITCNRSSVISHILGCLIFGFLNVLLGGYENILLWYSIIYFYNDIAYLILYEFKIPFFLHHCIALGCFYLGHIYPTYGNECIEGLLILEKGNILHTIWDWTKSVGIKPKIGFCKYMTLQYIGVRVGYLTYKVFTLVPSLYYDQSLLLYHRYIAISFTLLIYLGSLWWSYKLYLGYQKLLFKSMFEKSQIVVGKAIVNRE